MFPVFKNDRLAPDVLSQPEVHLHHWRIVQRPNGDLHITTQIAPGVLRVTSRLLAIDLSKALLKTESGRSYHLCAPPELDQVMWSLLSLNGVRGIGVVSGDVSEAVWGAISSGAWANDEMTLLPPIQ